MRCGKRGVPQGSLFSRAVARREVMGRRRCKVYGGKRESDAWTMRGVEGGRERQWVGMNT